ncbi:MAG: helix-turn-helix domain-containing protein [Planctomycetes bacterium]|nr:helix-turn-helix domain-containing protein [Planctomycetota bacterium]
MFPEIPTKTTAIGRAVRAQREEKGWTLRDLAEKVGMTYTLLGKKERGEINISPPERRNLAHAFDLTLEQFDELWRAARIEQSRVNVGIPVINRSPAGGIVDMDECGTDSGQGFEYLDRDRDTAADLLFAVIVTGNSMEPHLHDGDYVVFHPLDRERARPGQPKLVDGTLVRAQIRAEQKEPGCTIARYYAQGDQIRLQKDNTKYPPIIVPRDAVEQLAVAIQIRHKRGLVL